MMTSNSQSQRCGAPVSYTLSLSDNKYDSIILVVSDLGLVKDVNDEFHLLLTKQTKLDENVAKDGCIVETTLPSKRLVYAPTGPVNRDYDDVRRFADATTKGVKRAITAGSKKPLLVVVPEERFKNSVLVSLLAALEALYLPLQFRELRPEEAKKIDELGIYGKNEEEVKRLVEVATALEGGRYVARDLGGADPERMPPPKFTSYVEELFENTSISVHVLAEKRILDGFYSLFAAVSRAADSVERHKGRIIYLTYEAEGPITQTLLPVGKGICYDTGGADIKAGGIMAGMSRDKCGAAAVVGFFQVLDALRPKGIKATGGLALARNSVGEECYVSDEVIMSRANKAVRVINTDAEGRLAMIDTLCKLKTTALKSVNPHLFTIATLTGHAHLSVGDYTAVMDNGPARQESFANRVQAAGEALGDMLEVSRLRREDYESTRSKVEGEDYLQCKSNAGSGRTPRGHQFPPALMIGASGLDEHGIDSAQPIKYSHFDIAGSSGDYPAHPTGVPILALANVFFGDQFL